MMETDGACLHSADPANCAQAPLPIPPINSASPLIAQQPIQPPAVTPDISDQNFLSFDTFELQHALLRSRQQAGACGGLRRATSAPHSMDTLGWEPSLPQKQAQQAHQNYLAPTGGPMRRIASSIGMRRSSSFFWTPAAHHDFERAINSLSTRGADVSASNILGEMSHALTVDLKLADVDKHLRKKMLVQRRVLQQLTDRPGNSPSVAVHAPGSPGSPTASPERSTRMEMSVPSAGSGMRTMAVPGLSRGPSSSMAAVAEEPSGLLAHCAGAEGSSVAAGAGAASDPSTAAAAQAISDSLSQQLQAQRMQHLQLAAVREAMVAGENQISPTQMQQQA